MKNNLVLTACVRCPSHYSFICVLFIRERPGNTFVFRGSVATLVSLGFNIFLIRMKFLFPFIFDACLSSCH